jgi:hypothetical protein
MGVVLDVHLARLLLVVIGGAVDPELKEVV